MTTTTISLEKTNHEELTAPPKKRGAQIILVITCLVMLAVLAGIGIRQNSSDQSLASLSTEMNALKNDNSTLAASYVEENNRLKQELTIAQKNADDWKLYASDVTAQLAALSAEIKQVTIKETEKLVYVNGQIREFESPDALMKWANENLATLWFVGDQVADCDDYAARLQLKAYQDGYIMSVQLIKDGLLNGKNVSNYLEPHMGNLAMVGNNIYFIEPQPEYFRIVYVCHRD